MLLALHWARQLALGVPTFACPSPHRPRMHRHTLPPCVCWPPRPPRPRLLLLAGIMDAAGPKPTAANQGTLISVGDLFFNVPLRKKVDSVWALCGQCEGAWVGFGRQGGTLLVSL